jgi:RNA polymerase sigma-B factor
MDDEIERLALALEGCDQKERADLLDEMVLCAIPLADSIARRYGGRGIDADDLVQVARLAAVKAVRRYRPGAGPGFTAFAVPTIYGEVKRYFRDHGWAVRPPRRLQELRARLQAEEERLRHELMREPADAELADVLECEVEEIEEARACSAGYHAVSLDTSTPSGGPLADQVIGAACPSGDVVVRDALRRSIASLNHRQRIVVSLRFGEELTQSQIAERIGVSQMQVSRMLSRILDTLRRQLDDRGVDWPKTG